MYFFSLTPLLAQQTRAAGIFAGCKDDFSLLLSFYSSILYDWKPVLAKMEISGIKLFPLFLLFCQFNKYDGDGFILLEVQTL